ncbi:unnamed protein product [Larinioides sclopetarius]|uniref:Uncharacterized protein n=1 Tax=Larinioides sclopetarius TaxID=280406 RepID=A0AAV2A010_9ARAC
MQLKKVEQADKSMESNPLNRGPRGGVGCFCPPRSLLSFFNKDFPKSHRLIKAVSTLLEDPGDGKMIVVALAASMDGVLMRIGHEMHPAMKS